MATRGRSIYNVYALCTEKTYSHDFKNTIVEFYDLNYIGLSKTHMSLFQEEPIAIVTEYITQKEAAQMNTNK